MIQAALALKDINLNQYAVLFKGWFGPRGLASAVLGMVYPEQETKSAGQSAARFLVRVTHLI